MEAATDLAEVTALTLLDDGLIELVPRGSVRAVDRARARRIILSDIWRTDPVPEHYKVRLTARGDRVAALVSKAAWKKLWRRRHHDEGLKTSPRRLPTL